MLYLLVISNQNMQTEVPGLNIPDVPFISSTQRLEAGTISEPDELFLVSVLSEAQLITVTSY